MLLALVCVGLGRVWREGDVELERHLRRDAERDRDGALEAVKAVVAREKARTSIVERDLHAEAVVAAALVGAADERDAVERVLSAVRSLRSPAASSAPSSGPGAA